jgi:DNA gyrase/topoisomerase IV subunit A
MFKKLFRFKQVIALSLALVVAVTGYFSYEAKGAAAALSPDLEFSRIKDKQAEEIGIDKWVGATNKLNTIKTTLNSYSTELQLNEKKRHIMKVSKGKESAYFVYYPMNNVAEKDSQYILIFDGNGTLVENELILGLKTDNNGIHSIALTNDKTIVDAFITETGKVTSGYSINSNGEKQEFDTTTVQPKGFWSCMNNCLASQGISAWAITTLGILCAVACIGTAGLGCYICLAAADIGAGATVGYCWGQCD